MFLTKLLIYPMTLLTITYGSASIPAEIYSQPITNEIVATLLETKTDEPVKEEKEEIKQDEIITEQITIEEEPTTVPEIIIEEVSEVVIKEEISEVETEEKETSASKNLFAEFSTSKPNIEQEVTTEKVTENQDESTTIEIQAEKSEISKEEQKEDNIANTQNDLYHPFKITGYSAETFNKVCEGTYLEGFGPYLVNLEREYGVNGMFCLGVARAESGMGSSNIAKTKNNYFGIMGSSGAVSYSSGEECIMSFGRLMNKSIYKGKTIEQIGPIYCENSCWAQFVRECMAYNFNKI